LIIDTGPASQEGRRARGLGTRARWRPVIGSSARDFEVAESASRERSSVSHRDASGLARAARGMLTSATPA